MSNVLIKYRHISFLPFLKKKWLVFPEKLESLSQDQFVCLCDFIFNKDNPAKFISSVLNIPYRKAKRLDDNQLFHLLELLNPIFESDASQHLFITSFKCRSQEYLGYSDAFKHVKFGEFIFADSYFQSYQSGQKASLDKLIAVLYRPASSTKASQYADCRIPFSESEISERTTLMELVPLSFKRAIATNYALMRRYLETKYPFVFPEDDSNTPGGGSWIDVYDSIVGDDIIHNKAYADLYLSTVLRKMNKAIKEEMRRS